MSNKKIDNYIDNYIDEDEEAPSLSNREVIEPLVCGGIGLLFVFLYFVALAGNDARDTVIIFVTPVFAIRGLIISLSTLKERFRYIIYWRLGFYSCAVSLAAFTVIAAISYLQYLSQIS